MANRSKVRANPTPASDGVRWRAHSRRGMVESCARNDEAHRRPDHGEKSYRDSGVLQGRKALITGGDSGIGRAAAIAFAREGADVAIKYLPAEEPDAREVVQLIRDAGRKAVTIPGDTRTRRSASAWSTKPFASSAASTSSSTTPRGRSRAIRSRTSRPPASTRRSRPMSTRRSGSPGQPCRTRSSARRSSIPHRSTPTIPARTASTTRPPRARS